MYERVEAMFPPEESSIQGEYRAALLGDDEDAKRPLRNDQKELLWQSVWSYILDLSRSKGGYQQDKLSDVHQISERRLKDERSSGGLRSVFD
jgi:hypothetical protein